MKDFGKNEPVCVTIGLVTISICQGNGVRGSNTAKLLFQFYMVVVIKEQEIEWIHVDNKLEFFGSMKHFGHRKTIYAEIFPYYSNMNL